MVLLLSTFRAIGVPQNPPAFIRMDEEAFIRMDEEASVPVQIIIATNE